MKKLVSSKLASMLIAAIFMLSFAGVAISQEAKGTDLTKVVGAISAVNPDTGEVSVTEKESGKIVTLTPGEDVDLKDFAVGDQIVAEYTPEKVIISIKKQTS